MANCYCNMIKNLLTRLIYSIVSLVIIIIIVVLMADSMLTSFAFQQQIYVKIPTKMTISKISEELKVSSFYFNISMPGKVWKIEAGKDVCMTFEKTEKTPLRAGQTVEFYKTLDKGFIPSIGNFTCMDKASFDAQKGQFYYQNYNLMMIIILAIFVITFAVFFIFMWLCCSGWCGCECCGICKICCDDANSKKENKVWA